MIEYHHFAEQLISDLALDLAYTLGNEFGEQFERWLRVNQTSSPNTKVAFFKSFELSVKEMVQGPTVCKNLGV